MGECGGRCLGLFIGARSVEGRALVLATGPCRIGLDSVCARARRFWWCGCRGTEDGIGPDGRLEDVAGEMVSRGSGDSRAPPRRKMEVGGVDEAEVVVVVVVVAVGVTWRGSSRPLESGGV